MKKFFAVLLALAMAMSLGGAAMASGDPSEETGLFAPETGVTLYVEDMEASEYAYLTSYTKRDDTGNIYIGNDITEADRTVVLDETVLGASYTGVYAHGEEASVRVTGTLAVMDDTAGEYGSDFSGQGVMIVGNDGARIDIEDATLWSKGFARAAIVVAADAVVTARNSSFTVLGANPLTDIYDGYICNGDQTTMIAPPWNLGLMGGARLVNMIGQNPTLTMIDCEGVAGAWALLSTDSGSNMRINVVDSTLSILPESEGGMDSGWRIFGYEEDAYGAGYGSYYIGNPSQYYYGTVFNGVTYAGIITGGETAHYTSSAGSIDLYDANGNLLETVEGKGQPTVVNGVFGIMCHSTLNSGLYIEEGTILNTEDACILHKNGSSDWYFDNAVLNSGTGVLFQMMDNDDDSRIGAVSTENGMAMDTVYSEDKVTSGVGFPGINYDYATAAGGHTITALYTNGVYNGDIYNGTGYYDQKADNLQVTLGEGAALSGDIALSSVIKGIPYGAEAVEGINYYGDDIEYVFLDADGNACSEEEAVYIQIRRYTEREYFLQGHVQNKLYYNGASTLEVTVQDGAVWTVEDMSLLTRLVIEDGSSVYGALTVQEDGTLLLTAADELIPAGSYGTIEAAAAAASASGEAS